MRSPTSGDLAMGERGRQLVVQGERKIAGEGGLGSGRVEGGEETNHGGCRRWQTTDVGGRRLGRGGRTDSGCLLRQGAVVDLWGSGCS